MRYLMMFLVVVLAGLFSLPRTAVIPEFFHQPDLRPRGPEVRVTVKTNPFEIEVAGDAKLERLDANRVRLTSPSGNIAIRLLPDESIYGLTARIVSGRLASETFVRAVGGLDRRGEEFWVANEVVRPRVAELLARHARTIMKEVAVEMKKPEESSR